MRPEIETAPPGPPGGTAASVALLCGLGSLLPLVVFLVGALLHGRLDGGFAAPLFLLAPVLGAAAIVIAILASARAERWGAQLDRRVLRVAVCSGVLGLLSFVGFVMLVLAAIPTT